MMRYWSIIPVLLGLASAPAFAGMHNLKYYHDPVYKKLDAGDHHPMDEMLALAEEGDVRAAYILGDMYRKGKGGLPEDWKEARRWFEEAAVHGYSNAFVRLAAIAKLEKNPVEAWQWYTLAIDNMKYGDMQHYAIKARHDLAEEAKLSDAEIRQGRKGVSGWEDMRSARLKREKEEARLKRIEEERAEKEKLASAKNDVEKPKEEKKDEQN